ncbi:MAG: Uma2 family endonuclease [Synechocystis sp.]
MQLLTRKFTVDQYHQMAQEGILSHQERIELVEGDVIPMSPIGFRHAATVNRLLNSFLELQLAGEMIISVQNSILLGDRSEPQPDIALLKPVDNFYADRLPEATDILLLIEVADSSLIYDQTVKIPLYAQFKIPEVWLINLNQRQLDCYQNPLHNTYQNKTTFYPDQMISPRAFPGLALPLQQIFT